MQSNFSIRKLVAWIYCCRLNGIIPVNRKHGTNASIHVHFYSIFLPLSFSLSLSPISFFSALFSLNTGCDSKNVIEKPSRSYFIEPIWDIVNACVNWERSRIYGSTREYATLPFATCKYLMWHDLCYVISWLWMSYFICVCAFNLPALICIYASNIHRSAFSIHHSH